MAYILYIHPNKSKAKADQRQKEQLLINKILVDKEKPGEKPGEKLGEKPGEKAFGLPSLKVQYFAEVKKIADVPSSVFLPKPKVESSLLQIKRLEKHSISTNPELLFELAKQAFNQRRKMLRRSLKDIFELNDFESVGIDPTSRAEDITLEEWISLTEKCPKKIILNFKVMDNLLMQRTVDFLFLNLLLQRDM